MTIIKAEGVTWEHIATRTDLRRRAFIGYVVGGKFYECFGDARSAAKKRANERGYRESIKRARSFGDIIGGGVAYLIEPDAPSVTKKQWWEL